MLLRLARRSRQTAILNESQQSIRTHQGCIQRLYSADTLAVRLDEAARLSRLCWMVASMHSCRHGCGPLSGHTDVHAMRFRDTARLSGLCTCVGQCTFVQRGHRLYLADFTVATTWQKARMGEGGDESREAEALSVSLSFLPSVVIRKVACPDPLHVNLASKASGKGRQGSAQFLCRRAH